MTGKSNSSGISGRHERRLPARSSNDRDDCGRVVQLFSRESPWVRPPPKFLRAARMLLARRRLRLKVLPAMMFGEAAWDILLSLYAEGPDELAAMDALAEISGTPQSTVARWIDYLESEQLVMRAAHRFDPKIVLFRLTDKARAKMDEYFRQMLRAHE